MTTSNIRNTISKSGEGFPLIGRITYWTATNFKHSVKAVRDAVAAAGLDATRVGDVRAKTAFFKATEEIKEGIAKMPNVSVNVKTAQDNPTFVVRVLTITSYDPTTFNPVSAASTKAKLNKDLESITFLDADGNAIPEANEGPTEQAIRYSYGFWKEHLDSDQFTDTVLDLLKHHCDFMKVRERGGVYFVPNHGDEALQKLVTAVSAFPEAQITTVPIINDQEAKDAMWETFTGEVSKEIEEMEADFSNNLDKRTSERSQQVRVERFNRLQSKIGNYSFLLSGTAKQLDARLERLAKVLTGAIEKEIKVQS